VQANKMHLGSLDSLTQVLNGKVGAALATYGVNLNEAAAVAGIASKAGITNSRSMVSLANSLGALENPTKAQDLALKSLGLSSAGLTLEMHKPDGLIQVLQTLADTAKRTGKPVGEIAAQIFGKGGAGTATVLINNIKDLSSAYKTLAGSNPSTLQAQFQQTMTQLGPQLQKAGANFNNALLNVGELILPGVAKVAGWVASFASAINSNKTLRDLLGGTLAAAALLAVASKVKNAFDAVKSIFTGSQQTIQTGLLRTANVWLEKIALSSATTAAEEGVADTELAALDAGAMGNGKGLISKILSGLGGKIGTLLKGGSTVAVGDAVAGGTVAGTGTAATGTAVAGGAVEGGAIEGGAVAGAAGGSILAGAAAGTAVAAASAAVLAGWQSWALSHPNALGGPQAGAGVSVASATGQALLKKEGYSPAQLADAIKQNTLELQRTHGVAGYYVSPTSKGVFAATVAAENSVSKQTTVTINAFLSSH